MATTPNRSWPTPDDSDLVRDGAAAIRALGDAIDGSVGQGFVYAGTRYYTSSGAFLKADPLGTGDIGLRAVRVTVVGGGGGGAGGSATEVGEVSPADGGGGGGAAVKFYLASDLDASEPVTRGAGGSGGTGADGTSGGTSSFKGMSATGGTNGRMRAAAAPPEASAGAPSGGVGSGGDINYQGQGGGKSWCLAVNRTSGGVGGAAPFSAGGGAVGFAAQEASAGTNGGGGGGTSNNQNIAVRTGGAGGDGYVQIDCFV